VAITSLERVLIKLESFFSELGDYVILRNHNLTENLQRGGDIDILVNDLDSAGRLLIKNLGQPVFSIRRSYVECFFYEWGHVDLSKSVEWRGAVYLDSLEMFGNAGISDFGYRKPRIGCEALVCWFSSLIWGGFFKDRYEPIVAEAARYDGEYFLKLLTYAVGPKLAKKLFTLALHGESAKSAAMVKTLRRALWFHGFARRPLETLHGLVSHYLTEVSLRIRPPVPWFAVLGLDGSGKTTLLLSMESELKRRGFKTAVYHWRPAVLRGRSKHLGPVTNPHAAPPRNLILSAAKLVFLWLDWYLGYFGKIASQRAKGCFVIFDRYYADLLADPYRYRYRGSAWLARLVFSFLPKPDAVIFLDGAPEALRRRKQETSLAAATLIRAKYLCIIGSRSHGYIVNADQSPSQVLDRSLDILLRATRNRDSNASMNKKV
jgi:thymidylate kinase